MGRCQCSKRRCPFVKVSLNLGDQESPLGSTTNNRKLLLINLKVTGSECQSILSLKRCQEHFQSFIFPKTVGGGERHWNEPCNFYSVIIPVTTSDRADINSQLSYFFLLFFVFVFLQHRLGWLMLTNIHTRHKAFTESALLDIRPVFQKPHAMGWENLICPQNAGLEDLWQVTRRDRQQKKGFCFPVLFSFHSH